MIFSENKFKKTNLTLALLVAMQGNFVLAEDLLQGPVVAQDDTLQLDDREASTITWPLLSGESVQTLSRLFYPKNKKMQRLFIQKTLYLSQEIRPNLTAYTTTNQASLIVIPNIKYLAKSSGKIRHASPKEAHVKKSETQPALHMSYGLKDADKFALTPEMQTKYEDLVKRNEKLKQDLEKLNAKLAHLQEVMAALNVEARRVQNLPALPEKALVVPEPISQEVSVAQAVAVVTEQPKPKAIKLVVAKPAEIPPVHTSKNEEPLYSQYFVQILAAILALGSIAALYVYRRKSGKSFSYISTDSLPSSQKNEYPTEILEEPVTPTKVDFSLTTSEFSSSIPDGTLDAMTSLKNKEEGDLVLEQARIYVNINRENEAIMILKAQIRSVPKASFHHWLALLDIYRKTNQHEAFLDCVSELHETFNVVKPTWENSPMPEGLPTSLLEFPHIIEPLIKLWGEADKSNQKLLETKIYLDSLLTDTRENERAGFNMEVFLEIMLLRDILDIRDTIATKS